MNLSLGDLVRVTKPKSLRDMNILGLITQKNSYISVWIPDINREISFDPDQLEIVFCESHAKPLQVQYNININKRNYNKGGQR